MHEYWTPKRLADVTGGRWLVAPPGSAGSDCDANNTAILAPVRGVGIDTRTLCPGQMFVAIRGERFDGHDYLVQAVDAGASLLIIDDEARARPAMTTCGNRLPPVLRVEDATGALADMAGTYRSALRGVVGVTGSAGKTTTRHLIHAVLSAQLHGTQSPKSFNNHLGVPLTLLNAAPGDGFVVAEIGTNRPGEIAALSQLVRPNVGVLTNVGRAHIGYFDGYEGLAREKAELLAHIDPDGGYAVVHGPTFDRGPSDAFASVTGMDHILIGPTCCKQPALDVTRWSNTESGVRFATNDNQTFDLPMRGEANVYNAMCAIAVGRQFGLEDTVIAESLRNVTPLTMRGQTLRLGDAQRGITVINDAYNANPDSMRHAVRVLADLPVTGRRVAVLGDMFELGESASEEHASLGEFVASDASGVDTAVFIGEHSGHAAEAVAKRWPVDRVTHYATWRDALPAQVAATLRPGDVVLIKASRGMQLERLIPAIEAAVTGNTSAAA